MGYIKLVWTALVVVVTLILSIPMLLVCLVVGLFSMDARDAITMWMIRAFFRITLWSTGAKLHLSGTENILKDQSALYVGNHQSFFDVVISYAYFKRITAFISKKEFGQVPILSWWMRMAHNLFLDRNDIKKGMKTILKAIEMVKDGVSICIYPEGTRKKDPNVDMLPFHAGSFKIAEKSGCPIIPMVGYNISAIFEDHLPRIAGEHVFLDFGQPIYIKDLDPEDKKHVSEYVRNIMLERYQELKKQYEELNVK